LVPKLVPKYSTAFGDLKWTALVSDEKYARVYWAIVGHRWTVANVGGW
jgi:hypothetical protein